MWRESSAVKICLEDDDASTPTIDSYLSGLGMALNRDLRRDYSYSGQDKYMYDHLVKKLRQKTLQVIQGSAIKGTYSNSLEVTFL